MKDALGTRIWREHSATAGLTMTYYIILYLFNMFNFVHCFWWFDGQLEFSASGMILDVQTFWVRRWQNPCSGLRTMCQAVSDGKTAVI